MVDPNSKNRQPLRKFYTVVPDPLWELINEVSAEVGIKPKELLTQLMIRIGYQVQAGHVEQFGEEYVAAHRRLKAAGKAVDIGPEIDTTKLDRSDRLKSGYVGVYANGKGFRADGRSLDGRGHTYLGTFQSAIEAAWARYQHHLRHNLPYGEQERIINQLWSDIETYQRDLEFASCKTDDELIAAVDYTATYMVNVRPLSERIIEAGVKFGSIDGTKLTRAIAVTPILPPGAKRTLTPEELAAVRSVTGDIDRSSDS